MKAIIETRKKHAVGTWPAQGPDAYVAVQVVPDGAKPLKCLHPIHAKRRGIKIIYCGEYYSTRTRTLRSMYGAAIQMAEKIVAKYNAPQCQH